jgi:hypothetical protein
MDPNVCSCCYGEVLEPEYWLYKTLKVCRPDDTEAPIEFKALFCRRCEGMVCDFALRLLSDQQLERVARSLCSERVLEEMNLDNSKHPQAKQPLVR